MEEVPLTVTVLPTVVLFIFLRVTTGYTGRADAVGELIMNDVIRTHSMSKKAKALFAFINTLFLSVTLQGTKMR